MATKQTFTVKIEMGDDLMQTPYDVASALRKVAQVVSGQCATRGAIVDDNGNMVGEFRLRGNWPR